MVTVDDATIKEWLQRDLDGDLTAEEKNHLSARLAQDPGLRREYDEMIKLHQALAAQMIPVRPGFRDEVLANLPVPAWAPAARQAWRLPVALLVVLGGLSAALLRFGPATRGSAFEVFASMAELLKVTLVAGAGLLTQSWKGLRLAFVETFSASPVTLVGVGLLVLGLNLLFVLSLRRRSVALRQESKHD